MAGILTWPIADGLSVHDESLRAVSGAAPPMACTSYWLLLNAATSIKIWHRASILCALLSQIVRFAAFSIFVITQLHMAGILTWSIADGLSVHDESLRAVF